MLEMIQEIYHYNTWANARILDCTEKFSNEQLHAASGGNFGSVHACLVHIMSVQWLWLMRWQGNSPLCLHNPDDFESLQNIRTSWNKIEAETRVFLADCDETDLSSNKSYTNFKNETWTYPLWQQMLHQSNHATQHRSEVAVVLTDWEVSPGPMDFLYFIDSQSKR
jgi:uncharacterized damage-inducible protein DinB